MSQIEKYADIVNRVHELREYIEYLFKSLPENTEQLSNAFFSEIAYVLTQKLKPIKNNLFQIQEKTLVIDNKKIVLYDKELFNLLAELEKQISIFISSQTKNSKNYEESYIEIKRLLVLICNKL